ncbi:MAG: DUF3408 domain-containing protein [Bacteroides thetaiotaomicron]
MIFNSFSNCDLLIVGIVLCVLLALIIAMLAKVLCQGKPVQSSRKGKKDTINHAFETEEFARGIPFEEFVKNPKTTTSYKIMFFVNADVTSRTGKMVNIRKKYHERIMKIIQVIGNNEITMFSYIDNVLKHHFDTYQDEIKELYNKNNESIF